MVARHYGRSDVPPVCSESWEISGHRFDMLYIPGGMPHAIGGGCFIYEVQQSSDTTYRFYDWDRAAPDTRVILTEL